MELVSGNNCVVEISNNPRTHYLINDACFMMERDPNTGAVTNSFSVRGEGPIPLVRGSTIGNEGKLTVYNHRGGVLIPIPQDQPYKSENRFFCYR